MLKKQILLIFLLVFAMTSIVSAETVIGIIQYSGGPVYDSGRDEFKAYISKKIKDVKFYEYNCNKKLDESTDKLVGDMLSKKPDLIFCLGSGTAEYLYGLKGGKEYPVKHKITKLPVVFADVTHPVNSGIIKDFKKPGTNFTGASVWVPPFLLFKMLKKAGVFKNILVPVSKLRIGNTKTTIELCEKNKKRLKMNFIYLDAANPNEVKAKLPEYLDKIDAIAVMFDNVALGSLMMGFLEEAQMKHKKPVVSVLPFTLAKGVFTFGTDFGKNGLIAAKKAYLILKKKKDPANISVFVDKRPILGINLKKAKEMGLKIPMSLLAAAKKIIK